MKKLDKQASDIKIDEFNGAIQEVLVNMKIFRMAVNDTRLAKLAKGGKTSRDEKTIYTSTVERRTKKVGAVEYLGPYRDTLSVWGVAKMVFSLIEQGQAKKNFVINAQ